MKYLAQKLLEKNLTLSTAESCTGGLVGGALTEISGSSRWFKGGIISYSNEIKHDLLHVQQEVLDNVGAVSELTVRQMAVGACRVLNTDLAVSISGIAGPDGGSTEKPVGTVWIGWAVKSPAGKRFGDERSQAGEKWGGKAGGETDSKTNDEADKAGSETHDEAGKAGKKIGHKFCDEAGDKFISVPYLTATSQKTLQKTFFFAQYSFQGFHIFSQCFHFNGTRQQVREAAVEAAIAGLVKVLE